MRAAVYRGGEIVADTVPDPVPEKGQVLVKSLACGICGSDLHMARHAPKLVESAERTGAPFVMDLERDIVFGHEFCAEVLDYGPDTERKLAPGTRVCAMPVVVTDAGPASVGYSNEFPGGYGELMVLQERLLLEVPDDLSTELASLTEPMAVGYHAVEKAHLQAGDIPLVIGCGPVGLSVIAALKLKGAGPILAADFSAGRRALAETMGADIILDPAVQSPYEAWAEKATPQGIDMASLTMEDYLNLMGLGSMPSPGVVFECVGVPGVIKEICDGALPRSRVVVAGVCMVEDHFEPLVPISKELNLQFVLGYTPEEFTSTLRYIASGELQAAPLVTGKVGVDEVPGAFAELASPEKHAKILVEPWR